jgi:hypothetical protein
MGDAYTFGMMAGEMMDEVREGRLEMEELKFVCEFLRRVSLWLKFRQHIN